MLKNVLGATLLFVSAFSISAHAESPADLNDLEIAHVAYTADSIDIRYAHLALAISTDPVIHEFAKTMIRDHEAVNEQALALVAKLTGEIPPLAEVRDQVLREYQRRENDRALREYLEELRAESDIRINKAQLDAPGENARP